MKRCSLNNFLTEIKPWLDSDYIRKSGITEKGHFYLAFTDGTKHVYIIDDCRQHQVDQVLIDLEAKGILVTH